MPFAGYKDFADCVSRNAGKANPKGYCATIQRAVEARVLNELELLEATLRRSRKTKVYEDVVPSFAAAVVRMFERQRDLLLAKYSRENNGLDEAPRSGGNWWLEEKRFMRYWEGVADMTRGEFEAAVKAGTRRSLAAGIRKGALDLESAFSLSNPRAQVWLNENAGWMVQHVNDATRNSLREILTGGREAGMSYNRLAQTMREQFGALSASRPQQHIRDRATLIATNETAKAYEKGTRLVADKLQSDGVPMQKSWLTVGDKRVDPDCEDYEGMGFIPLDGTFGVGIAEAPAHPACRCTMLYERVPTATPAPAPEPEPVKPEMSEFDKRAISSAPTKAQLKPIKEFEARVSAEERLRNPKGPGYGGSYGPERGMVVDRKGKVLWDGSGEAIKIDMGDVKMGEGDLMTHFHPSNDALATLSDGDIRTSLGTRTTVRAFNANGSWEQFVPHSSTQWLPGGEDFMRYVTERRAKSIDKDWLVAFRDELRWWTKDQGTWSSGR